MTRIHMIALLLVLSAAAVGEPGAMAGRPAAHPNVVFVIADQMRAQAMGCMGNRQVMTPNLDALAGEGLLVTNAISSQPVCTPFRAQLMTGRYGHATGVIHNDIRLPDSETVLPVLMKENGYTTGFIGKWHLSGNRKNPVDATSRRGWDTWAVRNCSHQHMNVEYWLNDSDKPTRAPGWEPEVQTDLAVEFIRKNRKSPFCLFVSFGPPHNPYKAPDRYVARYKGVEFKARPNQPALDAKVLLHYYAAITGLDECMGRITRALEEAGVREDTIVAFTSDHGDMLGSQGHRLKQRPWEESIRIPFIVRYPRVIKPAQRRDWIVSSVDMMPTLLGLCGIAIPKGVQGMDYSATFAGRSDKERTAAFLFNVHSGAGPGTDWRGIRTKEWAYAYHALGEWVLYDLKADPYELRNLVDDPKFADRKKELRGQLEAMRKRLGEDLPLKGRLPAPIRLPE